MSQKESAKPIGVEISEPVTGELSKLAELSRQAYERKDTKKCLDLTRSILLMDPDNADAQRMRSLVQSEMLRDLVGARTFIRPVQTKENSERQSQATQLAVPVSPELDSDVGNLEQTVSTEAASEAPFTTTPVRSVRTPGTRWLVAAVIVIIAVLGAVVVALPRFRTPSNPVDASRKPAAAATSPQVVNLGPTQPDSSAPSRAAETDIMPVPPPTGGPAAPFTFPATTTPASRPAAKLPDSAVIAAGTGTLAISSPTTVDIYKDGALLGSVPVTLELPAGTHTLEYRHGALSRNVTHVINNNEVTKAMITFDVNVRINSRPWAEVFVDGVERKSLGQTPLSGVRIPIGTVLIFENRQFQTKKYRVTGNETGIQNVFP